MKFQRFFRRYVVRSLAIFALFIIVNLAAMGAFIFSHLGKQESIGTADLLDVLEAGLTADGFGVDAQAALEERECGAFFVEDDTLRIRHSVNVDASLPARLTAGDIARMTRWYYKEHPVFVRTNAEGIIVLLCPKGSIWRYNAYFDTDILLAMACGVPFLFLSNVALCVALVLKTNRRFQREFGPLLSGIDALSHGEFVKLAPEGELADIRLGLNRAISILQQRDEARGRWIAGVSHDIRTPLSKVILQADTLSHAAIGPEEQKRAVIILRQSERIRRLVSDLNAASALEYDMQPLRPAPFYPTQLIRQIVTDLLNDGLEPIFSVSFEADESAELLRLNGDTELFGRAVSNLLYNSIQHNEEGCSIAVRIRLGDGYEVEVLDDGLGLQIDRNPVVRRLSRLETHGIGLDLVRRIAQAHGGSLSLENVTPHGCRALLRFPVEQAPGKN